MFFVKKLLSILLDLKWFNRFNPWSACISMYLLSSTDSNFESLSEGLVSFFSNTKSLMNRWSKTFSWINHYNHWLLNCLNVEVKKWKHYQNNKSSRWVHAVHAVHDIEIQFVPDEWMNFLEVLSLCLRRGAIRDPCVCVASQPVWFENNLWKTFGKSSPTLPQTSTGTFQRLLCWTGESFPSSPLLSYSSPSPFWCRTA